MLSKYKFMGDVQFIGNDVCDQDSDGKLKLPNSVIFALGLEVYILSKEENTFSYINNGDWSEI